MLFFNIHKYLGDAVSSVNGSYFADDGSFKLYLCEHYFLSKEMRNNVG